MKKTTFSGLVAMAVLLLGSTQSLKIANADTTTDGDISKDKGTVTTSEVATIYSLNNNRLTRVKNRALSNNSSWIYSKSLSGADGMKYYRVATNEWVPSNSLSSINTKNSQTTGKAHQSVSIGSWAAATVNSSGNRTGNVLPANSSWNAFSDTVSINGGTYYQIGSNEFVSISDTASQQATNQTNNQNLDSSTLGTIVGNSSSHVYHTPGQKNYKINTKNIVYFNTEQDAINAGYHKSKV